MKVTLDLDDDLVKETERRIAASGRTLKQELEDILRAELRSGVPKEEAFRLQLPIVKGELLPGVDLNDRDSLYDIMEGRR